ncbi:hypothetical protein BJ508DRAFT_335452 [Ascobolus immersus RN42]|uniref:Uncharacterized protein n=1 Tax=Ascobolus immersus RN42 TaxID=1160509 RepID=A0A3N4HEL2_ASCIM|nr:hypothetical protein BJ508DRAFT_335452 [Ascobolus immersus RN42]
MLPTIFVTTLAFLVLQPVSFISASPVLASRAPLEGTLSRREEDILGHEFDGLINLPPLTGSSYVAARIKGEVIDETSGGSPKVVDVWDALMKWSDDGNNGRLKNEGFLRLSKIDHCEQLRTFRSAAFQICKSPESRLLPINLEFNRAVYFYKLYRIFFEALREKNPDVDPERMGGILRVFTEYELEGGHQGKQLLWMFDLSIYHA